MPTVSVIVPVHNTEVYLHRCIDSILKQSFTDFELLLVDDGSTDNSGTICDEYADRDKRILVFHQENRGQAAARNYALNKALGEYVCFIDSDDVAHPKMIEQLYDAVMHSGAVMSICSMQESSELGSFMLSEPNSSSWKQYVCDERGLLDLFDKPYVCWVVCGRLLPVEIVKRNCFTDGRIYEDNAVAVKWLCEAGSIAYLDSRLYFYQINPEGTTKSERDSKRMIDSVWAQAEMLSFFSDQRYFDLFDRFYSDYLKRWAHKYHLLKESHIKQAKDVQKTLRYWWKRYNTRANISFEERQYICGVVYPIRERAAEWINAHIRSKRHDS